MGGDQSSPGDSWRPFPFEGVRPLVAFLIGFSALVLASNLLWNALFDVDPGLGTAPRVYNLWGAASSTLQFALPALVLRYENVRLREIGLDPRLLAPALAAGGAVVVAINVAVAGLGASAGNTLSLGLYPLYQSLLPGTSAAMLAATGVHHYLFTGPAEELAFRGYLQNKLVSLFGDPTRGTRAAAVLVASASFGLLHLPVVLLGADLTPGGVVAAILLSTVSGAVFGVIYELTRNLYLVIILHGFGDWWPLFVDAGGVAWPNWGMIALVYTLVVLGYRWWAGRASRTSLKAVPAD
jgi:membrane protease YdiL (CAAX protease family)